MGVTVFDFTFVGSTDRFLERVHGWMTTTSEGERYRVTKSASGSILTIKRGRGLLTAPIIIEFYARSDMDLSTEITATGYVRAFGLAGNRRSLKEDAAFAALPRRNG